MSECDQQQYHYHTQEYSRIIISQSLKFRQRDCSEIELPVTLKKCRKKISKCTTIIRLPEPCVAFIARSFMLTLISPHNFLSSVFLFVSFGVFEGTTTDEAWWSEWLTSDDLSISFCRKLRVGRSTRGARDSTVLRRSLFDNKSSLCSFHRPQLSMPSACFALMLYIVFIQIN